MVTAYLCPPSTRFTCQRMSRSSVKSRPNMSALKCTASAYTLMRPTWGGRKRSFAMRSAAVEGPEGEDASASSSSASEDASSSAGDFLGLGFPA